jgi:hypothetical protein
MAGYADFITEKGKGLFSHENKPFCVPFGGDKRDRTADLLNAIQALSQLSYTPMFNFCCFADRTNCILAEYYPFVNYFFRFFTN